MKTYHFLSRIILFSGHVESNLGPKNKYSKSVPLYHLLSQMGRTAVDVGRGGVCIFRAVSQQPYGSSKNHFYVHSVGIQYLVNQSHSTIYRVTLSILDKVIWRECHVKEHGLMQ